MKEMISTPIGEIELEVVNGVLMGVEFESRARSSLEKTKMGKSVEDANVMKKLKQEMKEYFEKKRKSFSIEYGLAGTTFQKKVWQVISNIPYGQTMTYKEIAQELGNEKAYRAVANSSGANPTPLFIPCYRLEW